MLFSSLFSIPILLLLLASPVLADTEALVFTRPESLPPRPQVSNFQILSASFPSNISASPGSNLLVHILQPNETSLRTDIGLAFSNCTGCGSGTKWMFKLSWLAQPATHISVSSSFLDGEDPSTLDFNPLLHLDVAAPSGLLRIAETLEPMLWGWMPLSCYRFAEVLAAVLTITFLLGLVGFVVKEVEELGEKVEREVWASQQKKVE